MMITTAASFGLVMRRHYHKQTHRYCRCFCRSLFQAHQRIPLTWISSNSVDRDETVIILPTAYPTGNDDEEEKEKENVNRFGTSYHTPVMWKECVNALTGESAVTPTTNASSSSSLSSRVFIDGTLGGGGHSEAILQSLHPGDTLLGCDVDPAARETATTRLHRYLNHHHHHHDHKNNHNNGPLHQGAVPLLPMFIPIASNFAYLHRHPLLTSMHGKVDGILLDLGVSSHQIDSIERGFTYSKLGPLDMRMNPTMGRNAHTAASMTAADLCNELDVAELTHIFRANGDEPRAQRVAESIVQHRPLRTTADLHAAVSAVTPAFNRKSHRQGRTATLARVFQALRILVNNEDKMLAKALTQMAPLLLKPGGKLVVLSYHSLEDRMVKRVMRDGCVNPQDNPRLYAKDMFGNRLHQQPFRPLGKFQKASDEEIALNSRARSAILRIAEKL